MVILLYSIDISEVNYCQIIQKIISILLFLNNQIFINILIQSF